MQPRGRSHALRTALVLAASISVSQASANEYGSWLSGHVRSVLSALQGDGEDRSGVVAPVLNPPALGSQAWEPLRQLLSSWKFTDNFAVAVGDASGPLFVYEHGNFSMHTPVQTASTSKWPSAMMIAGLVHDSTIASLDDPVHKYLSWWTKKPKDLRSQVTLRHLLSFTSGFGDGHPGAEGAGSSVSAQHRARLALGEEAQVLRELADQPEACDATGDVTACAKAIYKDVELIGKPGTVYSYNSNHLQLAGAVAVSASGLSLQEVIDKYLFKAFGFSESTYPGSNPSLAGGLVTTGHDYEQFLSGILRYSPLPKDLVDESEKDATPFMSDEYTLYGNYGFGHFLLCFDSTAGFTQACKDAHLHIDPGAFGFFPLIDRRLGYYFELVAYENGQYYPRSGIPEYLAVTVKPLIDDIMQGRDISFTGTHHTVGYNALSLTDVNYVAGCYVDPSSCA
ncbi:unnamed protein product [Polarella glacialis]|uniref:Beta-lactamase-related domain-containing protein n=1 Tax=Polarella glacialis TaxID=89957 RepID=A0A813HRI5_POLGL|nr:unnamed protein product [Polarella glacialis]